MILSAKNVNKITVLNTLAGMVDKTVCISSFCEQSHIESIQLDHKKLKLNFNVHMKKMIYNIFRLIIFILNL
jgi:hypothetical protein